MPTVSDDFVDSAYGMADAMDAIAEALWSTVRGETTADGAKMSANTAIRIAITARDRFNTARRAARIPKRPPQETER